MPRPAAFRWAMVLGRLAKPLAPLLPATSTDPGGATFLRRLRAMLDAVPRQRADAVAGRPAADLSGAAVCGASAWR